MQGCRVAPWIPLVSIAVGYRSAAAARRDSSVDVSSSQSNQRGFPSLRKVCGGDEANRSLWPNSEVHEESLPAMPALLLTGVQNKNNTIEARSATGISEGTSCYGQKRPRADRTIHVRTAFGACRRWRLSPFRQLASQQAGTKRAYAHATHLDRGGPDESAAHGAVASCFRLPWTCPESKNVGRLRYRYSLWYTLPTDFGDDSRPCLRSTLCQARIEVRTLVRRSCLHFRASVDGFQICCRKRAGARRSFQ